jgi:hypothetical protein
MDGWAAIHTADRPLLPVSTDSRAQDPLLNQRVNVATKSRPEPTQSVAGRPLSPLDLWFGPMWSTCHKHLSSDTIFGRIPNVLVIF